MKINFDKQSLNITSKRFNPFNFSIYGIDVKSEKTEGSVDPFKMLETLASAKKPGEDVAVVDKLTAMRSVLNK
ncbi:MAG: hypothetical protein ACOYWZ_14810 [Bacillota bacterium]